LPSTAATFRAVRAGLQHPAGTSNLYQLYNPNTGTAGTCSGKACVVRQAIPAHHHIDQPHRCSRAEVLPEPEHDAKLGRGRYFSYAGAEPDYYYAFVVRSDYTINQKQQLFGITFRAMRLQPGKNGYFNPVSGTTLTYQNKAWLRLYLHHNPTLVLDAHLTWTRFVNQNVVTSQDKLDCDFDRNASLPGQRPGR